MADIEKTIIDGPPERPLERHIQGPVPQRPIIDERRKQQLLALIGRVEELEKPTDLSPYSTLSYVDKLFPLAKTAIIRNTSVVLTPTDPSLVVIDSSGIERTVNLPSASKSNRFFIIINNSGV